MLRISVLAPLLLLASTQVWSASAQEIIYRGSPHAVVKATEVEEPDPVVIDLREHSPFKATVGQPWAFDFESLADVSGVDLGRLSWSASDLPSWLDITGSAVHGTPVGKTTVGESRFEVAASHEGEEARRSYVIVVEGAALKARSLSVGVNFACVLDVSGGVMCWGRNGGSELGNSSVTGSTSHLPVRVTGLDRGVKSVTTGWSHACAIMDDATLRCWGDNRNRAVAATNQDYHAVPVTVANLTDVVEVSLQTSSTCARKGNGDILCWGTSSHRGTASHSGTPVLLPVRVNDVTKLSSGHAHTCALTTGGAVYCWGGRSQEDQLGRAQRNVPDMKTPALVQGLSSGMIDVVAGTEHSCATRSTGVVICWGKNDKGQIGRNASVTQSAMPEAVREWSGVSKSLSSFGSHTCSKRDDDSVVCWGLNSSGELGRGHGNSGEQHLPRASSVLSGPVSDVGAGSSYTCVLESNSNVRCWGANNWKQLGSPANGVLLQPVTVELD